MKLWKHSTPRKRMLPVAGALLASSTLALLATAAVGAGAATAATAGGPVALLATVGNGPSGKIVVAGAIGDWGTRPHHRQKRQARPERKLRQGHPAQGHLRDRLDRAEQEDRQPAPAGRQRHHLLGQRQRQRPGHALQRHRPLQRHHRNRERDPHLHGSRPALPKRTEEGAVQPHRQRSRNARFRDRPRQRPVQSSCRAPPTGGPGRGDASSSTRTWPEVPPGTLHPPPAGGQGCR